MFEDCEQYGGLDGSEDRDCCGIFGISILVGVVLPLLSHIL